MKKKHMPLITGLHVYPPLPDTKSKVFGGARMDEMGWIVVKLWKEAECRQTTEANT